MDLIPFDIDACGMVPSDENAGLSNPCECHAFDTWTITGMLDTIAIDIEHCERWEAGRAAPGTCDLIIKATFDQEKGIPLKYIRMELGRPSNVGVMDWEITRFEPTR